MQDKDKYREKLDNKVGDFSTRRPWHQQNKNMAFCELPSRRQHILSYPSAYADPSRKGRPGAGPEEQAAGWLVRDGEASKSKSAAKSRRIKK
jgi:hypothetical protein